MMSVVGIFAAEAAAGSTTEWFGLSEGVSGSAVSYPQQLASEYPWLPFWVFAVVGVEEGRSRLFATFKGGVQLNDYESSYGDIGFDPLSIKPKTPERLAVMREKELNNGRLAMVAAVLLLLQGADDNITVVERLNRPCSELGLYSCSG